MKIEIFTFIDQFLEKIRHSFSIPKRTESGAEAETHLPDEKTTAEIIAKVQGMRRLLKERG